MANDLSIKIMALFDKAKTKEQFKKGLAQIEKEIGTKAIKVPMEFDSKKLERAGTEYFKKISDIQRQIKKRYKDMGEVSLDVTKNMSGEIEGVVAKIKKLNGMQENIQFKRAKIDGRAGLVATSSKEIDKSIAHQNKLAENERKLTKTQIREFAKINRARRDARIKEFEEESKQFNKGLKEKERAYKISNKAMTALKQKEIMSDPKTLSRHIDTSHEKAIQENLNKMYEDSGKHRNAVLKEEQKIRNTMAKNEEKEYAKLKAMYKNQEDDYSRMIKSQRAASKKAHEDEAKEINRILNLRAKSTKVGMQPLKQQEIMSDPKTLSRHIENSYKEAMKVNSKMSSKLEADVKQFKSSMGSKLDVLSGERAGKFVAKDIENLRNRLNALSPAAKDAREQMRSMSVEYGNVNRAGKAAANSTMDVKKAFTEAFSKFPRYKWGSKIFSNIR